MIGTTDRCKPSCNAAHAPPILLSTIFLAAIAVLNGCARQANAGQLRRVISLDGQWQVAEAGVMRGWMPDKFDHTVPVPGLIDMAQPPFAEVGTAGKAPSSATCFGIAARFRSMGQCPPWRG